MPEPVVRRSVVVPAPIERAFEVFTAGFGAFKPPEHNLLGVPVAETVFEPWVGGHIVDRGTDGSECRWAQIRAYEPPARVVFAWLIGPTWQLERDADRASEVEVRFATAPDGSTRLELEHRDLHRHGPGWEGLGEALRGDGGWPLYLDRYGARVREGATT